jgi:glucose-6-phosphate dehydrogenase assembly protein OpcA
MASACFIADDPEQADRYARLALVSMGSNSSHRTWDRLREMYRLTAQYADYPRIHELREEIKLALPKTQSKIPRARGGNSAQA